MLLETALEPKFLDIEVTEGVLMENIENALYIMKELKDIGVNITIDDFGTGFSSLGYLKHFHVDQLKIDKSFVRDIATDPEDASLCRAIISLAHNLKIGVVAEGVETEEQLRFLRENGCDLVQGYYLSKPLPAQEYAELLLKERTRPKA